MRNDNYLPCARYSGYKIQTNGFSSFQDPENDRFYFAFFDDDELIFRSEGYGTISGRDNGISSVEKNMKIEAHFKAKMLPDGKWVLSLRAGNHQEIGRSCGVNTEKDALALLPSARAERKAKAAAAAAIAVASASSATVASGESTATAKTVRQDDDYLACKMYSGHKRSVSNADFSTFSHEGKYYFAMLNSNDEVLLRSEGYKTEKSRDNGITSVTKNREEKNQFSVESKMNYHFVVLKAKNHQEIGRSCPYKSAEEANNFINPVAKVAPVSAVEAPVVTPVAEQTPIVDREDDYLACKQYEGHRINDKQNNVALFKHENGLFYFSLYHKNGRVRLRSEGFVNAKTRDEELSGVIKYKDDNSMYSKIVKGSYFMDVLKDKTGREIGRSCLQKVTAPAVVAARPPDREDDYLPCKAYQGHNINDKVNNVAFFKNDDLLYFVLYDNGGGVRLRSEGFPNAKQRDEELSGVLRYKDNKSLYSRIERSGHYMEVLKDKTGREVGRSCLKKEKIAAPVKVAAAIPPTPVKKVVKVTTPTPIKATAAAAIVAGGATVVSGTAKASTPVKKAPVTAAPVLKATAQGFNWAWLLLPVLLLGSFFLYRSCSNTTTKAVIVPPKVETAVPKAAASAPVTPKVAAAPVAAPISCDLQWILFGFDAYNIRPDAAKELNELAALLNKNKGTMASLVAYTDARGSVEYNNTLSRNRANAAKKYLQGKGIAAARIKTSAKSEADPYAKNTDDDSGRQFNRRVEIFLLNASGKEVCSSKAPKISNALKVK